MSCLVAISGKLFKILRSLSKALFFPGGKHFNNTLEFSRPNSLSAMR